VAALSFDHLLAISVKIFVTDVTKILTLESSTHRFRILFDPQLKLFKTFQNDIKLETLYKRFVRDRLLMTVP
jgi:hypothetical protein